VQLLQPGPFEPSKTITIRLGYGWVSQPPVAAEIPHQGVASGFRHRLSSAATISSQVCLNRLKNDLKIKLGYGCSQPPVSSRNFHTRRRWAALDRLSLQLVAANCLKTGLKTI
jgi:hypothetical protein